MSNYELYDKVLEALHEDEGTFNAAARNWVEGAEDAPFEEDEAKELFSAARIACATWRNKAINGRVSKIRMIEYIRKIAEKNLPNPYKKEEPKKESKEEPKEEPKENLVVAEEKKMVLGVPNQYVDMGMEKEETKKKGHFFGKR